jgi:hypothetical protein
MNCFYPLFAKSVNHRYTFSKAFFYFDWDIVRKLLCNANYLC